MIANRPWHNGLKSAALGLLIALSIILRLFGPAGMVTKDGYVAICAGAEIIYLKASELGVPADSGQGNPEDDHRTEACIWFSGFHAVELAVAASEMLRHEYGAQVFRSFGEQNPDQQSPLAFHARGPPEMSHLNQS